MVDADIAALECAGTPPGSTSRCCRPGAEQWGNAISLPSVGPRTLRYSWPAIAGWSGPRSVATSRPKDSRNHPYAFTRGTRPDGSGRDVRLLPGSKAAGRRDSRGPGRRDPGQQHLSLSTSSPKTCRSRSTCSTRLSGNGCRTPAVPRVFVHLSQIRPAADHRGFPAHRRARTDERRICDREDRRNHPCPIRAAAVSSFPGSRRCRRTSTGQTTISRKRRSHVLPALIRRYDDAKPALASGSSPTGAVESPRREFLHVDDMAVGVPAPPGKLRRPKPSQCRHRHRPHNSRDRPYRRAMRWVTPGRPAGTPANPTAPHESCWMSVSCAKPAGKPEYHCRTGIAETVDWYRTHHASARLCSVAGAAPLLSARTITGAVLVIAGLTLDRCDRSQGTAPPENSQVRR